MIPRHTTEALGKYAVIKSYVDANHAVNMENRRSYSVIIIYVNNAPIIWYSKLQNTVEASSFGSDFVALRITTEMIEALQYKLRCFGVPLEGLAEVFFDNKSVVNNPSVPTSVINKRHTAKCYHRVYKEMTSSVLNGYIMVRNGIFWTNGNIYIYFYYPIISYQRIKVYRVETIDIGKLC